MGKAPPKIDPAELRRQLERLKAERDALKAERTAAVQALSEGKSDGEQIAQLRLRLGELLSKFGPRYFPEKMRSAAESPGRPLPKPAEPLRKSSEKPSADTAPPGKERPPVDSMALGRTLFRAREYEGALKAFRQVNLAGMKPEERRPVEYLIATCLKHLGKLDEAAAIYREVASSKGDEVLADCAQWQLSTLRWQQDLDRQIQQLRQRLQSLENQP